MSKRFRAAILFPWWRAKRRCDHKGKSWEYLLPRSKRFTGRPGLSDLKSTRSPSGCPSGCPKKHGYDVEVNPWPWGYPIAGWFLLGNISSRKNRWELGVPLFQEPPHVGNKNHVIITSLLWWLHILFAFFWKDNTWKRAHFLFIRKWETHRVFSPKYIKIHMTLT